MSSGGVQVAPTRMALTMYKVRWVGWDDMNAG